MASVNRVILIGRLGADPEIRHPDSGQSAGTLSVATSESWKSKDGEQKERTEWHRCVVYGKTADFVGDNLKKGSQVYIEGRLQTRRWEDKEGKERYTTEVVVDRLQALGSKPRTEDRQAGGDDDIPY